MDIKLVPLDKIDDLWPAVRPGINKAIARGGLENVTIAEIYIGCRSGRMFLFVSDDLQSNLALEFCKDIRGDFGSIITFYSSKSHDWNTQIYRIGAFCAANGCNRLVFSGRKGWDRIIKKANPVKITKFAVTYEMELING